MTVYNIDTPNDHKNDYTSNVISENIYIQLDSERYNYSMLYLIIGHRNKYDAIPMESEY